MSVLDRLACLGRVEQAGMWNPRSLNSISLVVTVIAEKIVT